MRSTVEGAAAPRGSEVRVVESVKLGGNEAAAAPSTTLRAVPLPRSAEEDVPALIARLFKRTAP